MNDRPVTLLQELATALSAAIDALNAPELPDLDQPTNFYEEVRRFEIALIKRALRQTQGNQTRAARLLELNQPTLHGKIKQYGIHSDIRAYRDEASDDDSALTLPQSDPDRLSDASHFNDR